MTSAWLHGLRTDAQQRWDQHGWPSQRLEAWRNTNLRTAEQAATGAPSAGAWTASRAPEGVAATSLSDPTEEATARRWLGQIAEGSAPEHALCDRNTALFQDGVLVRAARGVSASEKVELVFSATQATGSDGVQRCLIVAEPNSDLTVVHRYQGAASAHVRNIVTEIVVLGGARVRYVTIQDEPLGVFHLATLACHVHRDARLEATSLQFGGKIGRFDASVRLLQQGASCQLNGLFVGDGTQHLDCNVEAHHDAGRTDSNMLFKGILDGNSSGVFRGNVLIHEGASKSTSEQLNRNLLLSERASVHTKPQLEIDNDDVRAAHGSTVGELDPAALFYLRSRGIDAQTAQRLMIAGFASEVLQRLPSESLRSEFAQRFQL